MPGMWGDHLGVVDLQLSNNSGKWQVTQAKAEARPIYDIANKKSLAAEDSKLVETLKADHDATRQFVSKPIGKSADSLTRLILTTRNHSHSSTGMVSAPITLM